LVYHIFLLRNAFYYRNCSQVSFKIHLLKNIKLGYLKNPLEHLFPNLILHSCHNGLVKFIAGLFVSHQF
jgi:hypothetical protein